MKNKSRLIASMLLLGCLAAIATGCSNKNAIQMGDIPIPGLESKKTPTQISKIVCFWQPAEGKSTKGLPTRGVAGQIMFFTHGEKSPIKLDDEDDVIVYMFDNQGTPEAQKKPIHRFDFVKKSWNAHLQNGQIGPTYHVFIPYQRNVIHQVKCTLNVRMVPKNGAPVSSEMTTVTLHGPLKEEPQAQFSSNKPNNGTGKTINVSTFNRKTTHPSFEKLANKMNSANRSGNQRTATQVRQGRFSEYLNSQAAKVSRLRENQPSEIQQTSGESTLPTNDPRDEEIRQLKQLLNQKNAARRLPEPTQQPVTLPGKGIRLRPAVNHQSAQRNQQVPTYQKRVHQPETIDRTSYNNIRRTQKNRPHPLSEELGNTNTTYEAPRSRHPLVRQEQASVLNDQRPYDERPAANPVTHARNLLDPQPALNTFENTPQPAVNQQRHPLIEQKKPVQPAVTLQSRGTSDLVIRPQPGKRVKPAARSFEQIDNGPTIIPGEPESNVNPFESLP